MSQAAVRSRIGLFGGTFDPPHLGHLVVADQVRAELNLDEVWFVVAGDPWQKTDERSITPAEERLRLVELALSGVDGLRQSDIEVRRDGRSYTIETVTQLQREHPDVDWLLIMGADAANGLNTWHRHEELRPMVELAIADRPGSTIAPPQGWKWERVVVPTLDISSSNLRQRMRDGKSVRFLAPAAVIDRCRAARLYV